MILNNEQDAIKQAIEEGYDWRLSPAIASIFPTVLEKNEPTDIDLFTAEILQDPAFWRALSKTRGWDKLHAGHTCPQPKCVVSCKISDPNSWKYYALRYFETRLSNGDIKAFWQSLP